VAQRLLRSPQLDDQLRAIERLASQNDYAAIQILVQAFADNPTLSVDPHVRIEAVRAFAPFASRDPVRAWLVTWTTASSPTGRSGPLVDLAADQAALALAASANSRAVEQLVIAVAEGGDTADRAARALLAHPPPNLEPLLHPQSLESPRVVDLLGHLGDLRVVPQLRKLIDKADIDVRVAAAVALARLGDASGAKIARDWIAQDGSTHALRIGAARTLTLSRDPLAPRAIAILLADPATRAEGLNLAELAPTPQLSPTLAGLLTIAQGQDRVRILAALARCGGPLAARTLEPLLQAADHDAAFALAHCRGREASDALARSLANPKTRRIAARASLVRHAELASEVEGLTDALDALSTSADSSDRFVGLFGLVLMDRAAIEQHDDPREPLAMLAACSAAIALPTSERVPCTRHLATTTDPVVRDGLAGSLLGMTSYAAVSTSTLLDWTESPRVSAPIFARLLGPRDGESYRSRIERLLASGDPDVRAQIAIGLGSSPQSSAASLLTRAYAFEPDPFVRRAIVLGLATRQSTIGRVWLDRAARLDPDPLARSLARHGPRNPSAGQGDQMLWLRLSTSQAPTPGAYPVRLTLPNGSSTVVVTAPDGQALVPGMPPGPVRIRVDGAAWSPPPPARTPGPR
jgi:HEAT repeat protein